MPTGTFLNPENVIELWDVRPGDTIADFGAGAGFFAIALARRVGPKGKVYAIDVQAEALEAVQAKIKSTHLHNIETIRADIEQDRGSGLKNESIDKVLVSNVFFQVENKKSLVEEIARILKPEGQAMVIDWHGASPIGPHREHRVSREDIETFMTDIGFSIKQNFDAGAHHFGVIFKKNIS